MRARTLIGAVLTGIFVAVVAVQAATVSQCPVRGEGACARVHAMLMRPPSFAAATLAATPMRAPERG
jgi:hypothetical protein